MSSDRQIEANRANGAKSHDPITPEGRLISSQNGAKHGLFSQSILLDGESHERFAILLSTLQQQFQPRPGVESSLVETLAVSRWRQMRVWALENASLNNEIRNLDNNSNDYDSSTRAAIAFRVLCDQSRALELMNRYETRYDRQYNRALDRLIKLRHTDDFAKRTQFD